MRNRALFIALPGLPVLAFALAFATPRAAQATTNFPVAIQNDLKLATLPPCALCHTTGDQGGRGTVNTPFGTSMRTLGLKAYDESTLRNALDEMTAQAVDSDGDCVGDIDELKQGTDPNVVDHPITCDAGAHGAVGAAALPRYGCGAHVAPSATSSSHDGDAGNAGAALGFTAGALGLAAVLRRRRSHARR